MPNNSIRNAVQFGVIGFIAAEVAFLLGAGFVFLAYAIVGFGYGLVGFGQHFLDVSIQLLLIIIFLGVVGSVFGIGGLL